MESFYFARCIIALGLIAGLHDTTADDEFETELLDDPMIDLSAFTEQAAPDSQHVQVSVEIDHLQNGLSYHRRGMFVQAVESYRKHFAYDGGNVDA